VQPACPAGDAGCAAQSDGSCNDPALGAVGGFCQYTSTCTPGALGCTCGSAASCVTANAQCLDGLCIVSQMGICASGEAGCSCNSDGSCTGGTSCDSLSGMCLFESCALGAPGCTCSVVAGSPPCAAGFTCTAGACVQTTCAAGGAGCACLPNRQCGVQGYTCVDLTRDGTLNACVGEVLCPGNQEQRCINECGAGSVLMCGECIYSQPICILPGGPVPNTETGFICDSYSWNLPDHIDTNGIDVSVNPWWHTVASMLTPDAMAGDYYLLFFNNYSGSYFDIFRFVNKQIVINYLQALTSPDNVYVAVHGSTQVVFPPANLFADSIEAVAFTSAHVALTKR
jgi:hypothetical protein